MKNNKLKDSDLIDLLSDIKKELENVEMPSGIRNDLEIALEKLVIAKLEKS